MIMLVENCLGESLKVIVTAVFIEVGKILPETVGYTYKNTGELVSINQSR
jgi:hypothetical protein